MKAKTIKQVLRKKIDDWASHVDDKKVAKIIKEHSIVTGGSIASMLLQEKVNDYDIYFDDKDSAAAVAKYYIDKYIAAVKPGKVPSLKITDDRVKIVIKSSGVADESEVRLYINVEKVEKDDGEKPPYRPIFMTSNAITLSDDIQIVIRFYGSPEEIHKNYDFTHCTNWWTSKDNHLELRKEALECLLARELRYQGSRYPLCSIIRTRKFIKRNFSINAGQYLKMALQLNELDLTDVTVLEDQLIGVDVTYFHLLIDAIRDKKDISPSYIAKIIDRIF